jgi:spermidine synthase
MPQTIVQGKTSLGQTYEVNFENGVKVLNSENANYSFGSLHQIMLKGITEVLKKSKPEKILMLGLGAGSALSILANKSQLPFRVTVVEIDKDLISIARQHFDLDTYQNIQIVCGDAAQEIRKLPPATFDLIIDDIFWDNHIPEFCLSPSYLRDNAQLLAPKGVYMRNTMNMENLETKAFEQELKEAFSGFYNLKHAEHHNKIYFCQK